MYLHCVLCVIFNATKCIGHQDKKCQETNGNVVFVFYIYFSLKVHTCKCGKTITVKAKLLQKALSTFLGQQIFSQKCQIMPPPLGVMHDILY